MPEKDEQKKIFVLDTNVILHDSSCIYRFEEHDVVAPITVLEELDQFKRGNDTLSYHAREFLRILDSLSGDKIFDGGVRLGPGRGKISVKLESEFHPDVLMNFPVNKPDHHILNIGYHVAKLNEDKHVILVSKDVNLRLKAKSIGLTAQDYRNDHVRDIRSLHKAHCVCEDVPLEVINRLHDSPEGIDITELGSGEELESIPNQFFIIRNNKHSVLAICDPESGRIKKIKTEDAYGIEPRNAEQAFTIHALLDDTINLVSISGKAGTGKTILALAGALQCRSQYRHILLARPIVPLSNKDIGYLPGDVQSKINPYMQPLYDNLAVIQNQFSDKDKRYVKIQEMSDNQKLLLTPLSYIRGRSLIKDFCIIDEAQNLTPHEVKTIITRAGDGTKMVFTGDVFQIDHPYLNSYSNGLSYLIDKMQGQSLFAHITLRKGERSKLAELASNLL